MPTAITSITELDQDAVEQRREITRTLLLELNDSLDTRRGPVHDLVLLPGATLATARQTDIDLARRSSSLKLINEDPTVADEDMVDATMSNYGITRKSGLQASGTVSIVVSALATVSVPSGAVFEANGQLFQSVDAFIGRTTEESVQAESDRLLKPVGDGTFIFTVEVQAVETGVAGMLVKDTLLVPQFSILNFLKAFATEDFSGGRTEETNAELAARALTGIAAETASNRMTMTSAILSQEEFADVLNSSIIGYGDAEQIRDQHSIIPVSFGGRVDWYVRTAQLPTRVNDTRTATLVEKTSDGKGIWQIVVTRDEHPGFYDIVSIVPEGVTEFSGSFPIISDQRSFDLTEIPGELLPDIVDTAEATFSRYQTAVIRFRDTETDTEDLEVNDTKDYDVTFRKMLLIGDIQGYVADRAFRYRGGDILVRAAVPCFVSIAFTIEGPADIAIPDADTLANDIAEYVNTLGFSGRLYASAIADIVKDRISSDLHVSAIDVLGQILRPNGTTKIIRSTEYIEIPYEPDDMVSGRTTVFICDPNDISISAATIGTPQVI